MTPSRLRQILVVIITLAAAPAHAVDPYLFVTDTTNSKVVVLNPSNDSIVGRVSVDPSPYYVAPSWDGNKAWVSNGCGGGGLCNISVIDLGTLQKVATISTNWYPATPAPSQDFKTVFALGSGGTLLVLDAASHAVTKTLSLPSIGTAAFQGRGLAVSPNGLFLYVAAFNSNVAGESRVYVYNALTLRNSTGVGISNTAFINTFSLAGLVSTTGAAMHVAFSTDSTRAYLTHGSGMAVVNVVAGAWLQTVKLGPGPSFPVIGATGLRPDGVFFYAPIQTAFEATTVGNLYELNASNLSANRIIPLAAGTNRYYVKATAVALAAGNSTAYVGAGYDFPSAFCGLIKVSLPTMALTNLNLACGGTFGPPHVVFSVPRTEPAGPQIAAVIPSSGTNAAPVVANIYGMRFAGPVTIQLVKAGQPSISAANATVVSENQITATLDLSGASAGIWDIVVTNADGQTYTLPGAFRATLLPPTLATISPSYGLNAGVTSITALLGSRFGAGATVKLAQSGQPDIAATNVSVVNPGKISADLNLNGVAPGPWDVVVVNPDGQSATLSKAFTVTLPAAAPHVFGAFCVNTAAGLSKGVASVDPATDALIRVIPFATCPTRVLSSWDGARLFVMRNGSGVAPDYAFNGHLAVVDVASLQVVSELTSPYRFITDGVNGGDSLAVGPDNLYLYALSMGGNIEVIDIAKAMSDPANASIRQEPVGAMGIGVSPDGKYLYAIKNGSSQFPVAVYNAATFPAIGEASLITSFTMTGRTATTSMTRAQVQFRADSARAYIKVDNQVWVADGVNHAMLATVTPATGYVGKIKSRPDGAFVYVPARVQTASPPHADSNLYQLDPNTLATVGINTGIPPLSTALKNAGYYNVGTTVDLTPNSVHAYMGMTNYDFCGVAKLNVQNNTFVKQVSFVNCAGMGNSSLIDVAVSGPRPDITAPTVTQVAPVTGLVDVPQSSVIRVEFSEAMDSASVYASFSLTPSVPGALSLNGKILTFTPNAPLPKATQFTAQVTVAATDLAGNHLSQGAVTTFETTRDPLITLSQPLNGEILYSTAPIVVVFSEAMNAASVQSAFSITPALPGTLAVYSSSLTYTPAAPLPVPSAHTVAVTAAATDLAGNPLVAPLTWSFTTAIAPDYFIFAVETAAGTVHVVNPETDARVKVLATGALPKSIAASGDGRKVYIGNTGTGPAISVVELPSLRIVSTVGTGAGAEGLAVTRDSKHLFAAAFNLRVFDTAKMISDPAAALVQNNALPGGAFPVARALNVSPDGKLLYVVSVNAGDQSIRLYAFDAVRYPAEGNAALLASFPGTQLAEEIFVEFSSDSKRVYIGSRDTYMIVDAVAHAVMQTVTLPPFDANNVGWISGLRLRPDGGFLYGPSRTTGGTFASSMYELNPSNLSVERNIPLRVTPSRVLTTTGIDVGPDSDLLYVGGFDYYFSGLLKVKLPEGSITALPLVGDGSTLLSGPTLRRVFVAREMPSADPNPPAQITTLAVDSAGAGQSSLSFSWTSVGDDGMAGKASLYEFRIATYPITSEALFNAARKVTTAKPQSAAGGPETLLVTGLDPDTVYYANVRALDNVRNIGPLSNSPTAKTVDIEAPGSITDLEGTGVSEAAVDLTWTAPGDNGYSGRAAYYDVYRYSLPVFDITKAERVLAGVPAAKQGTRETATAQPLIRDTTYYFTIQTFDEAGHDSLSAAAKAVTLDLTAPAPIADLAARTGTNKGEIELSWTAVGDDGTAGTAVTYRIWRSASPITPDNLDQAVLVAQNMTPSSSGGAESLVVAGLTYGAVNHFVVSAVDNRGNQGALGNGANTAAAPDLIAPAQISDLAAFNAGAGALRFSWTAPGDDGSVGTALRYELKYSNSGPIDTEEAYAQAVLAPQQPGVPSAAGSPESFTITGLAPHVPFYVALRAVDLGGNASALSNALFGIPSKAASVLTLAAPPVVGRGVTYSVIVVVTDEAGVPVPGVPVTLRVVSGASAVQGPATVTSLETGLAKFMVAAAAADERTALAAEAPGLQTALFEVTVTDVFALTEGPTTPSVVASLGLDGTSISAQWSSVDLNAGIKDYKVSVGYTGDASVGVWRTSAPGGFRAVDTVSHRGRLYNLGSPTQIGEFDASGQSTWRTGPGWASPLQGSAIVADRLYSVAQDGQVSFAGIDPSNGDLGGLRTATAVPFGGVRRGYRVAAKGGFLYVIGGYRVAIGQMTGEVYVAKPNADGSIPALGASGSWTKTAPLPEALAEAGVTTLGDALYSAGGMTLSGVLTSVYTAKPGVDGVISSWSRGPDLPLPRAGHFLEASGGQLYVVGGTDQSRADLPLSPFGERAMTVLQAAPAADGRIPALGQPGSWTAHLPTSKSFGLGVARAAGDRIVGVDERGASVYSVDRLSNGVLSNWNPLRNEFLLGLQPQLWGNPAGYSVASMILGANKTFFITGGSNRNPARYGVDGLVLADVQQLALNVDNPIPSQGALFWASVGPLPDGGRAYHASVGRGGRLYVLGGETDSGPPSNTVYMASADSGFQQWISAGQLPFANSKFIALSVGSRIYMIGGSANSAYSAPVQADGTLGAFVPETGLRFSPADSRSVQAVAESGRLYVAHRSGEIDSYRLQSDGRLVVEQPRTEVALPASANQQFALHAAAGRLYWMAGDLGVWSSVIGAGGQLGAWAKAGSFPAGHPDLALLPVGDKLVAMTPTASNPLEAFTSDLRLAGDELLPWTSRLDSPIVLSNVRLGPGLSYRAAVRSRNNNGVWSEVGVSAPVVPQPPVLEAHTSLVVGSPQVNLTFQFVTSSTPLRIEATEGIASITATLDGQPFAAQPNTDFFIHTFGQHLLAYHGTTVGGIQEAAHSQVLVVNDAGPTAVIDNIRPGDIVETRLLALSGIASESLTGVASVEVSADGGGTYVPASIVSIDGQGVAHWTASVPLPFDNLNTTLVVKSKDLLENDEFTAFPVVVFNKPFPAAMQIEIEPQINLPGEKVAFTLRLTDSFGRPFHTRGGKARASVNFGADVVKPDPASIDSAFERSWVVQDDQGVVRNQLTLPGLSVTQLNQIAIDRTKAAVQREGEEYYETRKKQILAAGEALARDLYEHTFKSSAQIQAEVEAFLAAQFAALQTELDALAQTRFDALFPDISVQVFNELGLKKAQEIEVELVISADQAFIDYDFPEELRAKATVLSIPQIVALTGLPTQDNGLDPNPFQVGDLSAGGTATDPTDVLGYAVERRGETSSQYSALGGLGSVSRWATDEFIQKFYRPMVEPLIMRYNANEGAFLMSLALGVVVSYVSRTVSGGVIQINPLNGSISIGIPVNSLQVGVGGLNLADLGITDMSVLGPEPGALALNKLSFGVAIRNTHGASLYGLPSLEDSILGDFSYSYSAANGFKVDFEKDMGFLQFHAGSSGWRLGFNPNFDTFSNQLDGNLKLINMGGNGTTFLSSKWGGPVKGDAFGPLNWIAQGLVGNYWKKINGEFGISRTLERYDDKISNFFGSSDPPLLPTIPWRKVGIDAGDYYPPRPHDPNSAQREPVIPVDPWVMERPAYDHLYDVWDMPEPPAPPESPEIQALREKMRKDVDKAFDEMQSGSGFSGNPINTATGNLLYMVEDFRIPGRSLFLQSVRSYNSFSARRAGPFGRGWTFNYATRLEIDADGPVVLILGDGSERRYLPSGSGGYLAPSGTFSRLEKRADGSFSLTHKHGTVYSFSPEGRLLQIVDKNSNAIALTYDGGKLARITDPSGRALLVTEGADGRIMRIVEPGGATTSYEYDALGDLIKVSAPGYEARYAYDAKHRMISFDDARAQLPFDKGVFVYDQFGRVTEEKDPFGRTLESFVYELTAAGLKTTVTDGQGAVTVDSYDHLGRWTRRQDAVGAVTQFTFDEKGSLTRLVAADNGVREMTYDAQGNLLSRKDPTGAIVTFAYDPDFNMRTKMTLPDQSEVRYTLDSRGNAVSMTDPVGGVTSIAYDGAGNVVSVTDAKNQTATIERDLAGQAISVTDAAGSRRRFVYDAAGRVTEATDARGGHFVFAYAAGQRLTQITYPGGETFKREYQADGRLQKETDEVGASTSYTYDERGRMRTVTDGAGGQTRFDFDVLGRLSEAKLPGDRTLRFEYDAEGRLVKKTDPLGNEHRYEYDSVSRVVAEINAEGARIEFEYDPVGRLAAYKNADGGRKSFEYDATGRMISITGADGQKAVMSYDAASRLTAYKNPDGRVWRTEYDVLGNAVKVVDPQGNVRTMEYDAANRIVRTVTPEGRGIQIGYDAEGKISRYVEANGNVVTLETSWDGQVKKASLANGVQAVLEYDAAGQVKAVTNGAGETTRFEYGPRREATRKIKPNGEVYETVYDAAGRAVEKRYPEGGVVKFKYDAAGRITEATQPNGAIWRLTYDKMGRQTGKIDPNGGNWRYAYTPGGLLESVTDPMNGVFHYAYDANGRMSQAVDARGGVRKFSYDAAGHLVRTEDPTGAVSQLALNGVGSLAELTDARGNKTTIVRDQEYFPVEVRDALGYVRRFTYDKLGSILSTTDPRGGVTTYGYDAIGRLISATDPAGSVTRYEYDLFGRKTKDIDPLGNAKTYAYDANGRLSSVASPAGTRSYAYDGMGRLVTVTEPGGRITRYAYDVNDRLTTITGPDGAVTRLEYDANGNRTAVVEPGGKTNRFEYDGRNRVVRSVLPDGSATLYAYDAAGNRTRVDEAGGDASMMVYDSANRLARVTDGAGNTTAFTYDAKGNRTSVTDPAGKITSYEYDALGRLIKVTDPAGGVTSFVYDGMNDLVSLSDPSGAAVTKEYDAAGRVIAATDAEGAVTRYTYDAGGRLLTTKDGLGRVTSNEYDSAGRVVAVTDALGRVTRYAYDAAGNRTTVTDALGLVTRREYDALGRIVATVDTLQNRTAATYDGRGLRISETDPEGHVTRWEYDDAGRVSAIVDALGGRRAFAYDGQGRRTSETAPDGAVTRIEYDPADRVKATVDALGRRTELSYDSRGNLVERKDARGGVELSAYDDLSRLVRVTDAEGGVWSYEYDASSRLTRINDANGHATTFAYDRTGRLLSRTDALGLVTRFAYDAAGNRVKLIKADGTELRYEYDAGNRLTLIKSQTGELLASLSWDALDRMTALDSPDARADYLYDAAGRLTRLSYPATGATLAFGYDKDGLRRSMTHAGETVAYAYDAAHRLSSLDARGTYSFTRDAAGRLTQKRYPNDVTGVYGYDAKGRLSSLVYKKKSGAVLDQFAYTYDANDNRLSAADNRGARTYEYDKLDRLVRAVEPTGLAQAFAYDAVGNRVRLTNTRKNPTSPLPPGQSAESVEVLEYSYDAADRILLAGATAYAVDAVGRVENAGPVHFEYDAFDRPKRVTGLRSLQTGEALPDSVYAYAPQLPDMRSVPAPLGARTKRMDSRGMTQFVVDATGNVAAELDASGAVSRRYVHTPAADDPLALTDEAGRTYYLLLDGQGSVSLLADAHGDPVQAYSYEAFGKPNVTARDRVGMKYAAREYDPDSQLQYNRAGYYDPALGRWLTANPRKFSCSSPGSRPLGGRTSP